MTPSTASGDGFRERLRLALNNAGLSQAEAARRMGVDSGAVSRWLTQGRLPRLESLIEIARVLGTSLDYLVGLPNAQPPPPREVNPAVVEAVRRLAEKIDETGSAAEDVAAALALPPRKRRR